MKMKARREYIKHIKRVLRSKFSGGNTITTINTWAVSMVRYTAGIIN